MYRNESLLEQQGVRLKRPAYQHYPSDWHGDPKLQSCSLAARGLWIEMLGLMHQAEPYGHLLVAGKDLRRKDILIGYLQGWVGCFSDDVEKALNELESADVFSRTGDGTIFSRRMVRDEKTRQLRASGGFKSLSNPRVPKPVISGRISSKDTFKDIQWEDEEEDIYKESFKKKNSNAEAISFAIPLCNELGLSGDRIRHTVADALAIIHDKHGVPFEKIGERVMDDFGAYKDEKGDTQYFSPDKFFSKYAAQWESETPVVQSKAESTIEFLRRNKRGEV